MHLLFHPLQLKTKRWKFEIRPQKWKFLNVTNECNVFNPLHMLFTLSYTGCWCVCVCVCVVGGGSPKDFFSSYVW